MCQAALEMYGSSHPTGFFKRPYSFRNDTLPVAAIKDVLFSIRSEEEGLKGKDARLTLQQNDAVHLG